VSVSGDAAKPGFGAALDLVEGVEGWLTDAQARRLWETAGGVRAPGRIVEIGSFRGRSTIILARSADDGVEVVAIDPHAGGDRGPQEITPDARRGADDHAVFQANLQGAGVADRIRHVRAMSQDALDAVDGPVDMLYVDGAHRYAPARADIERWGVRVSAGGTMLIHDAFNAIGVTLAQVRLLFFSRTWRYVGRSGSLAEYRRESLRGGMVVANALRQTADVGYFARNGFVKLALVAGLPALARLFGHDNADWPY
jgi:predicted O-methyltransferase YrrM